MFGLGVGEFVVVVFLAGVNLAVACLIYRDAARRGREPLPWAVLALITPLIGFLVYLGSLPRTTDTSSPSESQRPGRDVARSVLARIRSAGVR